MSLRFRSRRVEASLADVLREAGQGIRLWAGRDGLTIVQEGVATMASARGGGRCAEVVRQAGAHVVTHEGPGRGPVWMGGLAFDEAHVPHGVWSDLPAAAFFLPLRQWMWSDGQCIETRLEPEAVPFDGPHGDPTKFAAKEQEPGPKDGTAGKAFSCADRTSWAQLVHGAQQEIHAGRLTKVVAARVEELAPVAVREHLLALRQQDGTAFLIESGASAFYGCTPETLVRLQGRDVSTHALAGSADGATDGEALLASGKDVLEHELVAAFVRERLVEAGVRHVRQEARRLHRLRHVQHLETPVHGLAPEGTHLLDLAGSLHPTPAVCGTPRRRSLEWIREHEGWPRGWYAGAVGWFDLHGEGELSVALRCALQRDGRRHAFAGAGIVAGSEAAAEWRETEAKLASMREET